MMSRLFLAAIVAATAAIGSTHAAEKPPAVLYKNPQCGCCEEYAKYLRTNGYDVTVKPTHDMSLIKKMNGVSEHLEGCHTTMVGGYVVEGHVPVKTLDKLLAERPNIKGISLPGMPQGSPGMSGRKTEPFKIYELPGPASKIYAVE